MTSSLSLIRGELPAKSKRPGPPPRQWIDRRCTAIVDGYRGNGQDRCGRGADDIREVDGHTVQLCWQHAKKFDGVYVWGELDEMCFEIPDGTRLVRANPGPMPPPGV